MTEPAQTFHKGDTVRITIPHTYQEQDLKILVIDGRRMRGKKKRGYKLGAIQLPFQSVGYFTADEIKEYRIMEGKP